MTKFRLRIFEIVVSTSDNLLRNQDHLTSLSMLLEYDYRIYFVLKFAPLNPYFIQNVSHVETTLLVMLLLYPPNYEQIYSLIPCCIFNFYLWFLFLIYFFIVCYRMEWHYSIFILYYWLISIAFFFYISFIQLFQILYIYYHNIYLQLCY